MHHDQRANLSLDLHHVLAALRRIQYERLEGDYDDPDRAEFETAILALSADRIEFVISALDGPDIAASGSNITKLR